MIQLWLIKLFQLIAVVGSATVPSLAFLHIVRFVRV